MRHKTTYQKGKVFSLLAGVIIILFLIDVSAFSGNFLITEDSTPVEFDAIIMAINLDQAYLIVAEKMIHITSFTMRNQNRKTRLLNQEGSKTKLVSFKKGQRVRVKGYLMENDEVVALSVQKH